MNRKDLKFILQEGEGFKVEFKENSGGLDKDMVAFANAGGGRIFLGIDDAKKVKGIGLTNRTKAQIQDIARNCDPPISINISSFENVVIINVPPSDNKPHKCSSGFYLRKDAASQKMGRDELVDFIYDQGRKNFDALPSKFKLEDLDRSALKDFLKKAGVNVKTSARETLFNIGVYENGKINNSGILFFAKSPKKYFLNAYITCARYLGLNKTEVLDRADFEGNIVSQVDEAIRFIKRNTRLSYKIRGIQREEVPEYPAGALREAVINAVMHRDYFERGANIQIDIFDDQVVVSNVGSLIKPLTREKLGRIAVRRNPLIADLFHRIKYVEKMGTGLARIKQECKKHGVGLEIETNGLFIVTFKSVPVSVPASVPASVPLNERQKWLLKHLLEHKKITTKEFHGKFMKVSLKTIKRDLAYLRKNRIIKFIGAAKKGHYVLSKTRN
ncbi:MAG: RNA-binding domain-containing protein [Candidatus Margulisiibacteriota bacterium]